MDYRLMQRKARLREVCSRFIYPWLVGLSEKNKAEKSFPLFLGDFYQSQIDKEVAEAVSLIVPLNANRDKYLLEMRNILGACPHEMIKSRSFFHLSEGCGLLRPPAFSAYEIVNIFDWVWETLFRDKVPLEYVVLGELGVTKRFHTTPLNEVFPYGDMEYKLQMLLCKMTLTDGFGTGMWEFTDVADVPCPLSTETMRVLRAYYPIENGVLKEDASEIIKFFGFERPSDFMYTVWEYQRLRRTHREALVEQEKRVKRRYKSGLMTFGLKPVELEF